MCNYYSYLYSNYDLCDGSYCSYSSQCASYYCDYYYNTCSGSYNDTWWIWLMISFFVIIIILSAIANARRRRARMAMYAVAQEASYGSYGQPTVVVSSQPMMYQQPQYGYTGTQQPYAQPQGYAQPQPYNNQYLAQPN